MISTIAVFFGGGFGALVRYFISKFFSQYYNGDFPVSTLLSNLISCLVVGLFLVFLSEPKYLNQNKISTLKSNSDIYCTINNKPNN